MTCLTPVAAYRGIPVEDIHAVGRNSVYFIPKKKFRFQGLIKNYADWFFI